MRTTARKVSPAEIQAQAHAVEKGLADRAPDLSGPGTERHRADRAEAAVPDRTGEPVGDSAVDARLGEVAGERGDRAAGEEGAEYGGAERCGRIRPTAGNW